jgi:hypothetical protein
MKKKGILLSQCQKKVYKKNKEFNDLN